MARKLIAPARPELNEIATAEKDLDVYSGWMTRLENPDTVLRQEAAGKGVKLYEELERDWQVFAMLQTRTLALKACEWQVEPASERRDDKKIAEFVDRVFKSANFDKLCEDLMQAVLTGYKPAEVMWEASEGDYWVTEFRGRRPSRFIFDTEYRLRMLTLQDMVEGEVLPDQKFIVWSFGGHDFNPYGRGLGYQLYWPVWFKKHGLRWWMEFCEQFAAPTPVGKYPPGSGGKDNQDRKKLLEAIRAIRRKTGITIPDNMIIELLEAKRSGADSYDKACEYFDKSIAKVVIGQTLTSDQGDRGSQSLGNVHERVKNDIMKADADGQCETLNRTVVRWIVDYNFPPPASGRRQYPTVWRRTEPEQDLNALAERDKIILVDMGMKWRVPESYIEDTYGMPLAKDGERPIAAPSTDGTAQNDEITRRRGDAESEFAEPETQKPKPETRNSKPATKFGQLDIDRMGDAAIDAGAEAMEAMLQPLVDFIARAETMEEIAEHIYDLYPQLHESKFQELLARSMFMAGLTGYGAAAGSE